MSSEYVEHRIKQALKLSHGNKIKARQQIIAWTFEDSKLLYALAKPHLSGIVAYNIERVASGRADDARKVDPLENEKPKAEKKPAKGKPSEEQFGLEILKAVAGSPQIFGLEDPGAPRKRGAVSKSHIEAIQAMASKKKR